MAPLAELRAQARTIEEVIATWREDAAVLRRTGHDHDAELLDRVLTDVARATEEFRTWLSEANARLQSGRGRDYFRARRAEWEAAGHARRGPKGWEYRQCVVPHRINLALAREAGRRGERFEA